MKIVHVITRLILGGAQENTVLSAEFQSEKYKHDVFLLSGPAEGPEGDLYERAKLGPYKFILEDSLSKSSKSSSTITRSLSIGTRQKLGTNGVRKISCLLN